MVHTKSMAFPAKQQRSGGTNMRTLGSVRKSTGSMVEPVRFPPLTSPSGSERSYQSIGVSGNAMQVPPPPVTAQSHRDTPDNKPEPEERHSSVTRGPVPASSPRKPTHSSKSVDSAASVDRYNDAKAKELKEAMARESKLKQTIMQLQKVIDDLRMQVKDKEKIIDDLQKQFERQEEKYKDLYEKEQTRHADTKDTLTTTQQELAVSRTAIADLQAKHQRETAEIRTLMDVKLKDLREEKDKEISIRDEKLNKLKKQMADALKGNSWERQQQLDELTKELARVQDDADMLRMRIKSLQKAKGGGGACSNCDTVSGQLASSQQAVKDRDNMIKELKLLCNKFEKQLGQQDTLLRQFVPDRNGIKKPSK